MESGIYVRVANHQINQAGQTKTHNGLSFFCGVHNATESPIRMA